MNFDYGYKNENNRINEFPNIWKLWPMRENYSLSLKVSVLQNPPPCAKFALAFIERNHNFKDPQLIIFLKIESYKGVLLDVS